MGHPPIFCEKSGKQKSIGKKKSKVINNIWIKKIQRYQLPIQKNVNHIQY